MYFYNNISYNDFIQAIINGRGQWNISNDDYWEGHHIIPKCLGGEGSQRAKHPNIIWLKPEEHLIAHYLLAKENPNNYSLGFALHTMLFGFNKCKEKISDENIVELSYIYAEATKLAKQASSKWNIEYNKSLTKEERRRKANCGGQGMKKKLEDPSFYEEFSKKQQLRHSNMSIDEKQNLYHKVSESLKDFYSSEDGKKSVAERLENNILHNKQTSKIWRKDFLDLFGNTPEYYRKFDKLQEVCTLYKQIRYDINRQRLADEFNTKLKTIDPKPFTCTDPIGRGKKISEANMRKRQQNDLFKYKLDNKEFLSWYELMQYINIEYYNKFQCKLSTRAIKNLCNNQDVGPTTKLNQKKLFYFIKENLIVEWKENSIE